MLDKQIAADLGISFRTVRHHFEALKGKANLQSRTQVAVWFVNLGASSLARN